MDWYTGKEELAEIELIHKRRFTQSQKGSLKYKPLTKADMLVKWHNDEVYVDKVIADCKKRGAYRKDCFLWAAASPSHTLCVRVHCKPRPHSVL